MRHTRLAALVALTSCLGASACGSLLGLGDLPGLDGGAGSTLDGEAIVAESGSASEGGPTDGAPAEGAGGDTAPADAQTDVGVMDASPDAPREADAGVDAGAPTCGPSEEGVTSCAPGGDGYVTCGPTGWVPSACLFHGTVCIDDGSGPDCQCPTGTTTCGNASAADPTTCVVGACP
jgi:hypothetical protein